MMWKIHGPDEATHDKHLIQVLNQCRKVGLKLNAEKCIFKADLIPFFGHIVSREGVKPDPKKMDAIRTMMIPTSKLEFQSFLGLCNYLAIYVPSLVLYYNHSTSSQRKNTNFQWNHQYDILYKQAKDHILDNWQTYVTMTKTFQYQLRQMPASLDWVQFYYKKED